MSHSIEQHLLSKIQQRKLEHNFRSLKGGNYLIDFTSNDYLGLARDQDLRELFWAEIKQIDDTAFGSTGSRLLSGNSKYAEDLETYLAAYHQSPTALLFNSGYTANYGLLSSLPYRGDTIVYDELVHASIHDGIRGSKAEGLSFRHNDLNDLEQKLTVATGLKYVVIESLYSMEGDLAPLKEVAALCEKMGAGLIVDEAHATGLMGKQGEGRVLAEGIAHKCLARIHTFGKAIGGQGAVVLGSELLKDFLINYCRPFIYSTALPFYALAYLRVAFPYLSTEAVRVKREKLFQLVALLRENLKDGNYRLLNSDSPIQSVVVPGNDAIQQFTEKLRTRGFDVRPIKYPTVPDGTERVRICVHSYNTEKEVLNLAQAIQSL